MIALNTPQTIVAGVVVFFALLALITLVRIVLRREAAGWRSLRVGFFIERDVPPEEEP